MELELGSTQTIAMGATAVLVMLTMVATAAFVIVARRLRAASARGARSGLFASEGRGVTVENSPGQGLLVRMPCQGLGNLSIGARVALAGLTGTLPEDRVELNLGDSLFAGLMVWTDDSRWAAVLLDAATRAAVLRLLRPGKEVRSVYVTPGEVCVRALSIGQAELTPERMEAWVADLGLLARRVEEEGAAAGRLSGKPAQALTSSRPDPGPTATALSHLAAGAAAIPKTLVLA